MMRSAFPPDLDLSFTTPAVSKLAPPNSSPQCRNLWRIVHLRCQVSGCNFMLYGTDFTCHVLQIEISEAFLRLCLPLDDSRELFNTEKEPFRWFKGDSERSEEGRVGRG